MSGNLTEEQLRRIEENKKKALARRAVKMGQSSPLKVKPLPSYERPKIKVSVGSIHEPKHNAVNKPVTQASARPINIPNSGYKVGTITKSSMECVGPGPESHSFSTKLNINSKSENNNNKPYAPINNSGQTNHAKVHVGVAPKTELHVSSGTSASPQGTSVSGAMSNSVAVKEKSVQERIEENRRKALEKLAEKNKSPIKSSFFLNNNTGASFSGAISDTNSANDLGYAGQTVGIQPIKSVTSSSSTSFLNSFNKASADALNNRQPSTNQQPASVSHEVKEATANSKNIFTSFSGKPVKGSCVLISRDRFEVNIGFNAPLVQLFKTMDTKLYDAVTKKWSFRLSEYNRFISAAKTLQPAVVVDPLPKAILQVFNPAAGIGDNQSKTAPTADLSRVEASLVNSLMSFQREGVNYGIWKNGRVLIADDMGLGKTIQAICLACYYRQEWPLLIVVPSSVRFDWAQENYKKGFDSLGFLLVYEPAHDKTYKMTWATSEDSDLPVYPRSLIRIFTDRMYLIEGTTYAKRHTHKQFQRWVPSLDPQEINVAITGKGSCSSGLVNILSYDLMAKKGSELRQKHYQVIIMDECHLLKNYKTARCKAAMPLLQNSRRVILLSGTPALSRPSELYTQICAICPFLFKFNEFGVRYCDGKQQPWGWDFSGSSNMAELQLLLEEKIMIRRLKKDVLSQLPDKVRQMVLLDPRSIKVDKNLKKASKVMTKGNLKGMEQRGALLEFFHQSGKAKMAAVKTYVEDLLEGDRKFIIFAHHQEVLDGIEAVVKEKIGSGYIRIDGRTNSEQRNYFCKKFQQNDKISVAILSITAANAGLNLSAATLVVFAELFWNPGILVQAEDRAHRIGQQDSVSVHYLVATGTSDDHIWPMIQKKLDVLGKAGLTKDDFSSADTTRVKDPRQEEIIKFLEESFSEDFPTGEGADTEESSSPDDLATKKKIKTGKQLSIEQFCSPLKDIPETTSHAPSTPPKPRGLFRYFTPSKSKNKDSDMVSEDKGEGLKGACSYDSEAKCENLKGMKMCDSKVRGDYVEGTNNCDNELDTFLKDDDDLFDDISEPQKKKPRT